MMWFRRSIAIFLILIFIILFIPLLVIFRVNDTAGNPHFYTQQLHQSSVYNFAYDEVLPYAIDQAYTEMNTSEIDVSVLKPYIAPMIEKTIPRAWLQAQVEQVINSALPYTLGDTNNFQIQIDLKERVETCAQSIKDTLHQEEVFNDLYNQTINLILDDYVADSDELLPDKEQTKQYLMTVIPPQWVLAQIDLAIDELVPYLTGDQEHFALHLDLSSRLDSLEAVTADILKDVKVYDYIVENVLVPALQQNIQTLNLDSNEISLTNDDIINVAKDVCTLEWYQSHVSDITILFFAYLKGSRPTLDMALPLSDRKLAAVEELSELVNQRDGTDISEESLPYLTEIVEELIPDQLAIEPNQLGNIDVENTLAGVRDYVNQGFTYSDEDLQRDLGSDFQTVQDIRQQISAGFSFTEQDLKDLIANSDNGGTQLQNFENIRIEVGAVRRWRILAWLVPALILLAIGALAARKWINKLIWAASVLAATALITCILFGPLFSTLAQPRISEALAQATENTQGFEALISGKGIVMAQNAIDSFIRGIVIEAIILLVVCLALIMGAIIWQRVRNRKLQPEPQQ